VTKILPIFLIVSSNNHAAGRSDWLESLLGAAHIIGFHHLGLLSWNGISRHLGLGGDEASVDRSDDGNASASTDDESDYYGIDSHDKFSTKWLVFGACGSLVNAPPELISKSRGRPPKVDNMLHGLSDALTRY
jgi:hypothetical protein